VAYGTATGQHAGLWTGTAASWVDLNPDGYVNSVAWGVSGNTQVGHAVLGGSEHAGLWTGTAASWFDLHPTGYDGSLAFAVSGNTQVGCAVLGGPTHAGLWNGTAATWVDLNPSGYDNSVACAVSGNTQVGYAYTAGLGNNRAGLWTGTAASWVDLHALLPSDYDLSEAYGIDTADGETWVAGYARNSATGNPEAILWHYVVPEPSSLLALLCGLGGFGGMVWRRKR
jgi:hypothetical protein